MELEYLRLPWHAEGYHIFDADGSHVGLTESAKVSCGGMAQYIAGACSDYPDLMNEIQGVLRCFERDDVMMHQESRPSGKGVRMFITYKHAERLREIVAKAQGKAVSP